MRMETIVIREMGTQAYPCPAIFARWLSSIVEWYIQSSEQPKEARALFLIRFLSCCIFGCAHWNRPESITPGPLVRTLMKKQTLLRVWTTSLHACRPWRLQTRCAMLLIHLWSSMFAAESSTLWLEISPTSGLADPLRFPPPGSKATCPFR